MFDSDEITQLVILVTDGNEILAYRGILVENNLVEVTSMVAVDVKKDATIGTILRHV